MPREESSDTLWFIKYHKGNQGAQGKEKTPDLESGLAQIQKAFITGWLKANFPSVSELRKEKTKSMGPAHRGRFHPSFSAWPTTQPWPHSAPPVSLVVLSDISLKEYACLHHPSASSTGFCQLVKLNSEPLSQTVARKVAGSAESGSGASCKTSKLFRIHPPTSFLGGNMLTTWSILWAPFWAKAFQLLLLHLSRTNITLSFQFIFLA